MVFFQQNHLSCAVIKPLLETKETYVAMAFLGEFADLR
jgi:hypothetical protein